MALSSTPRTSACPRGPRRGKTPRNSRRFPLYANWRAAKPRPLYTACMARRHPLPPEIYALLSRRRPQCCLRAGNRTTPKPGKNRGRNCSRLRCAFALRLRSRRFRRSSRKLKARLPQGHCAAASSATSAQAALSRRPEPGRRIRRRPLAWFGIYEEATFSITQQEGSKARSRRSLSDSAASCDGGAIGAGAGDRRGIRAQ